MIKKINTYKLLLLIVIAIVTLSSCKKKDQVDTSPSVHLAFSADTVFFDTVFTTVGSVTQRLMVYNNNPHKILVSSITLGGSGEPYFSLNIDGVAATSATDIEIPANDSIFILSV